MTYKESILAAREKLRAGDPFLRLGAKIQQQGMYDLGGRLQSWVVQGFDKALVKIGTTALKRWIECSYGSAEQDIGVPILYQLATHDKLRLHDAGEQWLFDPLVLLAHLWHDDITAESVYATTVHNHRYGFVSRILSGEIVQERCGVVIEGSRYGVETICQETLRAGDTYTTTAFEFHRLISVAPGTVTLLLQGLPCQRFSVSLAKDAEGEWREKIHVPRQEGLEFPYLHNSDGT